jgi:hypothetical protein
MSDPVLSYQLYRWAKYFIYAMLTLNIGFFLAEELASAQFALEADDTAVMSIQLFSATLDTLAWVILLLLFEAETAVIPDYRLKGLLRFVIHAVRMLCTLAICLAFLGYIAEWTTLLSSMPASETACSLVSDNWVVMLKLDEFIPLTVDNCAQWGPDTRMVLGLEHVLAAPSGLLAAQRLALADVINAGAWILVVVLLEIDVRVLTRWDDISQYAVHIWKGVKLTLYLTLVAAAIFWGFKGNFLDFWDAALWLFAFVFIELNVFEWQQEIRDDPDSSQPDS